MIQRQEVHPEFCPPPEVAKPAATCGKSLDELYINTADSENVMFGLATNRCCLTAGDEHPASSNTASARPALKCAPLAARRRRLNLAGAFFCIHLFVGKLSESLRGKNGFSDDTQLHRENPPILPLGRKIAPVFPPSSWRLGNLPSNLACGMIFRVNIEIGFSIQQGGELALIQNENAGESSGRPKRPLVDCL